MEFTAESIKQAIMSLKNEYNTNKYHKLDKYIVFMMECANKYFQNDTEKLGYIEERLKEYVIEVIEEFERTALILNNYMYTVYTKYPSGKRSRVEDFCKRDEASIYAKGLNDINVKGYTETNIVVPSNEIVFANYFVNGNDYAFALPKDIEYDSEFSINNAFGEQNTMRKLAELHNVGYAQLSNTTCGIYKVNNDKIIVTPDCPYYYNEKIKKEYEIKAPTTYKYLGCISCSVWRIEFMDKSLLENSELFNMAALDKENSVIVNDINPGKWNVKNFHHHMRDNDALAEGKMPVWVELTRYKDI